ncbi:MAG: hypothetical protein QM674_12205 [Burkholderiaceae bacterium]
MDLFVALDIALGLIVVYLTFSLAVTACNEGIAAVLSSRANWLKKGIEKLLTPTDAAGSNASKKDDKDVDKFYESPFIAHLGQGGLWQGSKPSYIPAWTIVQGMLGSVSSEKCQTFDKAKDIEKAIAGLPESSPIKVALNDLMTQAGSDVAKFRSLVEEWFKTFDAQVIAWYRQKTQYVVLGLSLFVVGVMNVDTVAIVRQLSSDPQARNEMVKEAIQLAKRDAPDKLLDTTARDDAKSAFDKAKKHIDDTRKALAEAKQDDEKTKAGTALTEAESAAAKAEASWRDEQRKLEEAAVDRVERLKAAGLKLGWTQEDLSRTNWYAVPAKLVGLLMSALAVSLGAPFWFDTLKSLAAIRSVGLNFAEREAKTPNK